GEQAWYRYPNLPERDGSSTLAYGGLRTDGTALISGAALGGMRWFRLESGAQRQIVYVNVYPTWHVTPRSTLGGPFIRDIDYSALFQTGNTPTNLNERTELFFEHFFTRRVYLRLSALQYRLASDGQVVLLDPEQGLIVQERKDRVREAAGEIGYQ